VLVGVCLDVDVCVVLVGVYVAGAPVGIELKPLPVDDPKVRQPDITRARTILNWEPEVTLEDGLTRTLEYFRKKLGLA